MSTALAFQSTAFDVVDHNNQPWIQSCQLSQALGYSSERSITNLYARNEDEFSNDLSVVIELSTAGIPTKTRIFSLRGCHLIAMFARTKVAKAFRVWVLDVLEKLGSNVPTPAPTLELTPSTPTDRQPLKDLVDAWVGTSPISYSAAWKQVNAHFSITKVGDLPKEWIPDAIAFVQTRIDAHSIPESPKPALPAAQSDDLKEKAMAYYNAVMDANYQWNKIMGNVERLGKELATAMGAAIMPMIGSDSDPASVVARHKFLDALRSSPRCASRSMDVSILALIDHAQLLCGLSVLGR